jgi:hypothetical protein
MKALLLGLLALSALGAGFFIAFLDRPDSRASGPIPDTSPPEDPLVEAGGPAVAPAGGRESAPAPLRPRRFAPGTVELRVGEGCDLTTGEVLTGDALTRADLACVDIHAGASFECHHGSMEPKLPSPLMGNRPTPDECFDRLLDAPPELPGTTAILDASGRGPTSGLAIVKSRSGEAFKVILTGAKSHFRVLSRSVTIRYAPVPTRPGGGVIRLEGQLDVTELDPAAKEALRRMLGRPPIPGDTYKSNVGRTFTGVATVPDKLVVPSSSHLGLASALQSELIFDHYSSAFLSKGLGKRGKARINTYAGLLVEGDMDGEIEVDSYAYVHITGNLNGVLRCRSYTTVIVDGNVNGLLQIKSYVRLFLGGRFADPTTTLEAGAGLHCTFFFSSYTTRADMEGFAVSSSYALHVRTSDLADGAHQGIGRWGTVTVADPLWQTQ